MQGYESHHRLPSEATEEHRVTEVFLRIESVRDALGRVREYFVFQQRQRLQALFGNKALLQERVHMIAGGGTHKDDEEWMPEINLPRAKQAAPRGIPEFAKDRATETPALSF